MRGSAASAPTTGDEAKGAFEAMPRRIFLDSCVAQTIRDYGGYIVEGETIASGDRIRRVPDGIDNVEALRHIFLVNERAQFEWMVSAGSFEEAADKHDRGHSQWIADIAHHSDACLDGEECTAARKELSLRLTGRKFGYLSVKDQRLLQEALALGCDAFLTMERRLPRNAAHLQREVGLQILTPISHWRILKPWAALWL